MFLSASVLSNKCLMEEATKCLFRTSVLNGCRIKQAHLAINRRQRKKNKRNVDLYSAFTATPPQGAQVWITVLPPNCRRKWRITNSDLCP